MDRRGGACESRDPLPHLPGVGGAGRQLDRKDHERALLAADLLLVLVPDSAGREATSAPRKAR